MGSFLALTDVGEAQRGRRRGRGRYGRRGYRRGGIGYGYRG